MANNMMNFQQMIQFIKAGNNPEQFIMMMLQNGAKNNPVFANILQLAQNKNYQGVENVVKNLAKWGCRGSRLSFGDCCLKSLF